MKNGKRLFLFFITVCLTMFLCTGCWNYQEIEQSTIVAGIAIDKGRNGYKYHITYEVLYFSARNDQSIQSSLIETDGNSIFDTLRKGVTLSDQKLYLSGCKLIILSKEIAQDGVMQLIDFFLRDAEPRITSLFAVSEEETAAKILNIPLKENEAVSYKIYGMLDKSQSILGHILSVPIYQMYNAITSVSHALTLPNIRLVEIAQEPQPQLFTNAIFKQDKLVGNMNEEENLYYLILKNKIQSGLLLTEIPGKSKTITLEILDCTSKIKPVINGDNVTMEIKIIMNTALGEDNSQEKYKIKTGELKKIEEAASKTVEKGVMDLISDMQDNYNADVFGFGTKINQDKYEYWKKISDNWDSVFPDLKCKITADIRIFDSATTLPKGGN